MPPAAASENGTLKVAAVPMPLTAPATRGRPPPASPVTTPTVGARDGERNVEGLREGEVDSVWCAVREVLRVTLFVTLGEAARVLVTVRDALTLDDSVSERV